MIWYGPKRVGGSAGLHLRFLYIYYFAFYLTVLSGEGRRWFFA